MSTVALFIILAIVCGIAGFFAKIFFFLAIIALLAAILS